MTGFLASVTDSAEAELALAGGADLIDLKDPAAGALGALPLETLAAVAGSVAGRRPVSATAGDLPMEPARIVEAVGAIAGSGVDIVKIGIFPDGAARACLRSLRPQAEAGRRLVAVFFADLAPDLELVETAAEAGFVGVMLDTARKGSGSLRRHLDEAGLRGFLAAARSSGLFAGLAGSLALDDVPPLLALGPGLLGFRTALTSGARSGDLDPEALSALRAAIPRAQLPAALTASSATAAAGAARAASSRTAGSAAISEPKSL